MKIKVGRMANTIASKKIDYIKCKNKEMILEQ